MDDNTRPLILIGVIFLAALGFQVFTNYIPSIMETGQEKNATKKAETLQEELKNKLQDALAEYIKKAEQQNEQEQPEQQGNQNIVSKRTPKYFSSFVSYKDNKPEDSTFNLDEYESNFFGDKPVDGLDSKTLVIKLIDPKTKKEETAVYLLNNAFISLAKF